jgi:hypothetical protein
MSYYDVDNELQIADSFTHYLNEQCDRLFTDSQVGSGRHSRCKRCEFGERCIVEIDQMCEGQYCDFHSDKWWCGGHSSECAACAVSEFCLEFKG